MKKLVAQIMKFGVVGVIAFVIDYGLLALLTEAFGVNYLVSATISFTVSVMFNYVASMRYVFTHKEGMSRRRDRLRAIIDADGKTGKDSAGTDGSYDGTPLEGKVNLQSSVGNVCKHAQSGDVDVAFVYTSDVYRFGGVKVIGVVPDDTHKNIIYPAAICKDSTQAEAANEFIEWATTNADAKKLWQEWGFELVS